MVGVLEANRVSNCSDILLPGKGKVVAYGVKMEDSSHAPSIAKSRRSGKPNLRARLDRRHTWHLIVRF